MTQFALALIAVRSMAALALVAGIGYVPHFMLAFLPEAPVGDVTFFLFRISVVLQMLSYVLLAAGLWVLGPPIATKMINQKVNDPVVDVTPVGTANLLQVGLLLIGIMCFVDAVPEVLSSFVYWILPPKGQNPMEAWENATYASHRIHRIVQILLGFFLLLQSGWVARKLLLLSK